MQFVTVGFYGHSTHFSCPSNVVQLHTACKDICMRDSVKKVFKLLPVCKAPWTTLALAGNWAPAKLKTEIYFVQLSTVGRHTSGWPSSSDTLDNLRVNKQQYKWSSSIITCKMHDIWKNEMKCRCFRPLSCTIKAELGRGQPGLMTWYFLWNLPQSSTDTLTQVQRTTTRPRRPLHDIWKYAAY